MRNFVRMRIAISKWRFTAAVSGHRGTSPRPVVAGRRTLRAQPGLRLAALQNCLALRHRSEKSVRRSHPHPVHPSRRHCQNCLRFRRPDHSERDSKQIQCQIRNHRRQINHPHFPGEKWRQVRHPRSAMKESPARASILFCRIRIVMPNRPRQIWSQGEAEDTRYYLPQL